NDGNNKNYNNNVDYAKKVTSRKPTYYQGEKDPNLLERWIRTFDKLFESIECPEEERIHATTYYLQGEADIWWSTSQADKIAQPNLNWDAFKTTMRDRFYPEHVKMQRFYKFTTLRHRIMTFQEHRSKSLRTHVLGFKFNVFMFNSCLRIHVSLIMF
ncbi:30S ribosomal protein S8 chloroplastic, partial [Bienertia sinuspersici]